MAKKTGMSKKEMMEKYMAMDSEVLKNELAVEFESIEKLKNIKKNHTQINEYKAEIKKFLDENVDEELQKQRKKAMDDFKDHKKSLLEDERIVEVVENKKAKEYEYTSQIREHRNASRIISSIIYDRKAELAEYEAKKKK